MFVQVMLQFVDREPLTSVSAFALLANQSDITRPSRSLRHLVAAAACSAVEGSRSFSLALKWVKLQLSFDSCHFFSTLTMIGRRVTRAWRGYDWMNFAVILKKLAV